MCILILLIYILDGSKWPSGLVAFGGTDGTRSTSHQSRKSLSSWNFQFTSRENIHTDHETPDSTQRSSTGLNTMIRLGKSSAFPLSVAQSPSLWLLFCKITPNLLSNRLKICFPLRLKKRKEKKMSRTVYKNLSAALSNCL